MKDFQKISFTRWMENGRIWYKFKGTVYSAKEFSKKINVSLGALNDARNKTKNIKDECTAVNKVLWKKFYGHSMRAKVFVDRNGDFYLKTKDNKKDTSYLWEGLTNKKRAKNLKKIPSPTEIERRLYA